MPGSFRLLGHPGVVLLLGDGSGSQSCLGDSREHEKRQAVGEDSGVPLDFDVLVPGAGSRL